jgi:hypothetical protein
MGSSGEKYDDHIFRALLIIISYYITLKMTGVVHGAGNRLVIPLKVRANLPKSKCFIVYFVVDSGAPLTSFSEKTVQKLCGKKVLQDVFIQGTFFNWGYGASIKTYFRQTR